MIPLGSYDLSDPKIPWIADRKRSTKSPIATIPLYDSQDLFDSICLRANYSSYIKFSVLWKYFFIVTTALNLIEEIPGTKRFA